MKASDAIGVQFTVWFAAAVVAPSGWQTVYCAGCAIGAFVFGMIAAACEARS